MVDQPYVLARALVEPDVEFPSLRALAAALLKLRDEAPRNANGLRPGLTCIEAVIARSDLPGGRVVAVRLLDGALNGRGTILGYAFMPASPNGRECQALMAALLAPAQATEQAA